MRQVLYTEIDEVKQSVRWIKPFDAGLFKLFTNAEKDGRTLSILPYVNLQ